ncbi:MAG: UDP-N-acetylglucosamine 2-epimerase (hydrolyzing) [Lachnospiraceae bacterium]|nr:UDP-N-acetylglucosamine 2-epimerase (hydrolyzing) [Lachnospiraceae bacterium]
MKKIAVITSTRAEYGLLAPVIKELRKHESPEFKVDVIVTGTHLSPEYGYTINEIKEDGIRIDHEITISVKSDSEYDISSNQADTLLKFTALFIEERYTAIVILGDRYEMLSIAIAAGNTNTPIFHLCGGDTTEGAKDEWIRHSITKMSYLHFVTNEDSRSRVIQLGEAPDRVFNFGSTSIDNILSLAISSKKEALDRIGLSECDYAICTYHPVTMEDGLLTQQMNSFLDAIKAFPEILFILTKSNADQGGALINSILDSARKGVKNIKVYDSLGAKRYLTLMKHSAFVLGNSSSGIIEAPAFHIPTVNIGNRQKGRLQSASIINCKSDTGSIKEGIQKALSPEFRDICKKATSPYGSGNAAKQITDKIISVITNETINLKKSFYMM